MEQDWKTISSKVVHKNPWFTIHEDEFVRPDGSKGLYYVMNRKSGVAIVPFDGKKLHLVSQYRYALKNRTWEFPVGTAENFDYLEQAKKELKEETGITAKRWEKLGQFAAAPGYADGYGYVFLAQDLSFGKPQREEGEQDMETKTFTLEEVDQMIMNGEIVDSWTIIPMYYFKQYLQTNK